MPAVPKFRRLRQEDCQFRAFLECVVSESLPQNRLPFEEMDLLFSPSPVLKDLDPLFLTALYIYPQIQ